MGAVRMRVHQLMSREDKRCIFIRNKSIKMFLTLYNLFQHNITPVIEKGEKYGS